ncbi:MAG TPA: carboxypeptidase-like regulatory domain-containing protein, partial [Longimicrobium sp.]|nr:carboxypeptidase-like regulatory domain-containing protein [Longimicrobium sp.]
MTPPLPLILCLALLALPPALHGQQGARFDVAVVDSAGAPVANARVEIAGVGVGATTNERGVGRIDRVPAGNRIVSASRIGYTAARLAVEFRAGETVARTITLTSEPVALAGVSASAARNNPTLTRQGFYQRQRVGHGAFMTGEAIDRIRPTRTVDLFRRMRGFTVILTRRGYYEIATTRGP